MSKCARCGCPRPQNPHSPYQVGLCRYHDTQYAQHTIGADHDPRVRETPVQYIWALIESVRLPEEKDRALARRIGAPKDTVHHARHQPYPVIRSEAAETVINGVATIIYQQHFQREYEEKIVTDGQRTAQQQQRRRNAIKKLKTTIQSFNTTQQEEKEEEKNNITNIQAKRKEEQQDNQLQLFAA